MRRLSNMCLLSCLGIALCTPAWAYLDANLEHHPDPVAMHSPTSSGYAADPAPSRHAAYVALSRSEVTLALQNYLDAPSESNYRAVAVAVADYDAFRY